MHLCNSKYYNQRIPSIICDDDYFFQMDQEWMYVGNRVTALLHIEILEHNSKLASKLSRMYTRNVKNGVLICHSERNSRSKWIIVLINKNKELMSMAFMLCTLYFTSSTRIRMRSRK
jgi:hypothetical protein